MKDYQLQEYVDLVESNVEESDDGAMVIRNAVLLGPVSKNSGPGYRSRVYTSPAMRDAVPLYEGARGYFNHATVEDDELRGGNRDVRDFAGAWRNVRFDESSGKLVGDFHVVGGPDGRQLADTAKRFPENSFGFSHDAAVAAELDETTETLNITRIRSVNSVDVVDRPATTRSFFEHQTTEDEDVTASDLTKATEARVKAEAERDELRDANQALESKNVELEKTIETLESAGKISETKALVEGLVSDISEPIAKRVRSMFDGKSATKESIEKAIEELESFATEVGGSATESAPRRTDQVDGDATDDTLEHVSGDAVFGAICGVDLSESIK